MEWHKYFAQLQDTTYALPCHIHYPICLWIMDPHSKAPKKHTSHGNEVLPKDTTHLIQRPCYQRGSPCQDPAGNRTTRRPDHYKEAQLQWYGHVSRSSGLAKTILQGTVKGGRRQGRQKKKWEDNIREWTGLEFAKSQKAVENWKKWRKLVAKSSIVPQRPSRLRDRWLWWWWWWAAAAAVAAIVVVVIPPLNILTMKSLLLLPRDETWLSFSVRSLTVLVAHGHMVLQTDFLSWGSSAYHHVYQSSPVSLVCFRSVF